MLEMALLLPSAKKLVCARRREERDMDVGDMSGESKRRKKVCSRKRRYKGMLWARVWVRRSRTRQSKREGARSVWRIVSSTQPNFTPGIGAEALTQRLGCGYDLPPFPLIL